MQRIIMMLSTVLFLFGAAVAQDQDQNQNDAMEQAQDFDIEQVEPMGNVQTGQEAYDSEDAGAIVLTHTTPDDQHANFDVVGPNGFHDHFDFEDGPEGEYVLDDLEPGIYSIAATDETFGVAHTVVEVTAGQSTSVHVELEITEEGARYDPAATYGQVGMQEQAPAQQDAEGQDGEDGEAQDAEGQEGAQQQARQPGYPFGAWGVGPYQPIDDADAGELRIGGPEDQDFQVVVTGPDGFYETAGQGDTISGLFTGQYVIAATGEELDLAVTTVDVEAGQRLEVTPNFGGAQAQDAEQQDAEQQDVEEQDAEEQDAEAD